MPIISKYNYSCMCAPVADEHGIVDISDPQQPTAGNKEQEDDPDKP